MKILHINTNYMGTTLHKNMVDSLGAYCTNEVFVPTHDPGKSKVPIGEHVHVSRCFRKWDRLFYFYKQGKIRREAERVYDIESFDLLHAYTLFTDGNVAYSLHKKHGIPYVVAVRNTDVNAFFKYRPHLRGRGVKILRNAAAVFFLSSAYQKQVMGKFVPKKYHQEILDKTHIIPNGIDPFWFEGGQAHSAPVDHRIRMIFAGNIDRNKNILKAAEGCRLLRKKGYDATLTVIGRVVEESVAEQLSNLPHVKLCPPMTKEELSRAYEEHDIFVMTSIYESFGLVYAEAMSRGLPVIYSGGQGFDGQFPDGEVGYGVRSSVAEDIPVAVEKILADYEPMSHRCVEKSGKFRWDAFAPAYYDIYHQEVSKM